MKDIQLAEEKFGSLDYMPVGACVLRNDFVVLFWNKCLEEWTKIPRSEILGTDINLRFPHLTQPKYAIGFQQIFTGALPSIFFSELHNYIIPCQLPHGQYRIQQATVTAVPVAKLKFADVYEQLHTIAEAVPPDCKCCSPTKNQSFYALLAIQDVTNLTNGIHQLKAMRDRALEEIKERMRIEEALRQQTERERLINLITSHIRQSLSLKEILNTTVEQVRQFLQADRVIFFQFYPDWSGVISVESVGVDWQSTLGTKIDASSFTISCLNFYQQGNIEALSNKDSATKCQSFVEILSQFQVKASLVVPILQSDSDGLNEPNPYCRIPHRLWGLLIAHQCSGSRQWHLWEIDLLKQLAAQVAIAIQQAELYEKLSSVNQELKRLATFDSLTHLVNRRRFDEFLNQEWRRLAREKGKLSLILCDIDFFKHYNDTYGHLAGDFCLQEVAAAIASVIKRPADLAARYGGEEFAVILPNTEVEGAALVAEEIRLKIKDLQIFHSASEVSQYVTMSLGVACTIPIHHSSPVKLITAADKALYQAKAKGRDRVQIYDALW